MPTASIIGSMNKPCVDEVEWVVEKSLRATPLELAHKSLGGPTKALHPVHTYDGGFKSPSTTDLNVAEDVCSEEE